MIAVFGHSKERFYDGLFLPLNQHVYDGIPVVMDWLETMTTNKTSEIKDQEDEREPVANNVSITGMIQDDQPKIDLVKPCKTPIVDGSYCIPPKKNRVFVASTSVPNGLPGQEISGDILLTVSVAQSFPPWKDHIAKQSGAIGSRTHAQNISEQSFVHPPNSKMERFLCLVMSH